MSMEAANTDEYACARAWAALSTAHALVAQIEGTLSLARNSQDPETLSTGARALRRFLASMRAN